MRVLFFTSSVADYLSDSLLHGLRSLLGVDLVDFPKRDILYKNSLQESRLRIRGHGFTLYGGLLDDLPIDRAQILERLDEFDLIVFGDIWRQYGLFIQLRSHLDPRRTVLVDGADSPKVYPYAGHWLRRPYYWLVPRAQPAFTYFKREWTHETQFNVWHQAIPVRFRRFLPSAPNLRRIAFSIPEEKIVQSIPHKTKDFPMHIVDPEVSARLSCKTTYVFSKESEYYADLQTSRFGITTKRSGWDCLRHYEIAANGAVPCFRNLDEKLPTCAPHGLDRENCIVYRNADDLLEQIRLLTPEAYEKLQDNTVKWARENSTKARAEAFLAALSTSEFASLGLSSAERVREEARPDGRLLPAVSHRESERGKPQSRGARPS